MVLMLLSPLLLRLRLPALAQSLRSPPLMLSPPLLLLLLMPLLQQLWLPSQAMLLLLPLLLLLLLLHLLLLLSLPQPLLLQRPLAPDPQSASIRRLMLVRQLQGRCAARGGVCVSDAPVKRIPGVWGKHRAGQTAGTRCWHLVSS